MARVLIVDDDPPIQRLLALVLNREAGLETVTASNGEEAIDRLRHDDFDAIVLDLMMPVASGLDVLQFLKGKRPDVKCVVVITAAGARGTKGLDMANIRTILSKPFDIAELVSCVKECIGESGAGLKGE